MTTKPRPTFEAIYMDLAISLARRSTCRRLAVGCVIVSPDYSKVLSIGYNGNASGLPNDCDSDEPGKCGCIHAETNALIKYDSPRQFEKIVFVTDLPCLACAKLMINLGNVTKIYYSRDYRIRDSLALFDKVGIPCHQFGPL